MIKRCLLATLWSAVLLLGWSAHAAAHSSLHHSDPAADSTVEASPPVVQLWFSKGLEPSFSNVTVIDQQGKEVDKGDGAVKGKDAKLLEVSLPSLAAGTYKVVWRVVATDGHKLKGEYNFTVK